VASNSEGLLDISCFTLLYVIVKEHHHPPTRGRRDEI